MRTPDWSFWLRMPEVEWDAACALALNIDPDSLTRPDNFPFRSPGFLRSSFPNYRYADKFSKLYRLLEANINDTHFTSTDRNTVRLPEFAAWCASIDWDIPPKLAALAKTPDTVTVVKNKNKQETEIDGNDWKEKARIIADECFDHDTNLSTRDRLLHRNTRGDYIGGYAFRVMEKMQERGIHGPRGRIDNAATIAREALQGEKWWGKKEK